MNARSIETFVVESSDALKAALALRFKVFVDDENFGRWKWGARFTADCHK